MLGSTLYLAGHDGSGSLLDDAYPCKMCQRMIINAGISRVICRISPKKYIVVPVREWIERDDTL
jgi:dCMP deaminase